MASVAGRLPLLPATTPAQRRKDWRLERISTQPAALAYCAAMLPDVTPHRSLASRFSVLSLALSLGLTGLTSAAPRIDRLEIHPDALDLRGPDVDHALIVTGIARDGQKIDLTRRATYTSDT